jgi:hypothetical protein
MRKRQLRSIPIPVLYDDTVAYTLLRAQQPHVRSRDELVMVQVEEAEG